MFRLPFFRLWMSAALALVVLIADLSVPDRWAIAAAATALDIDDSSVDGRELKHANRYKGAEDELAPAPARRRPIWPRSGNATLTLSDGMREADGLDVAVSHPPTTSLAAKQNSGRPAKVSVETFGADQVRAIGGVGVGVTIRRADGAHTSGPVRVALSYDRFRDAFGANFSRTVRLVRLPACVMQSPRPTGCDDAPAPVPASNDVEAGRIVADIEVGGRAPTAGSAAAKESATSVDNGAEPAAVYMLSITAAAAGSGDGTFSATDLKPSGRWQAGTSGGSFTWTYPVPEPPSPAGDGPGLDLVYDSASLDSRAWFTNPDAGWVADGWEMPVGFIERRYLPCATDIGDVSPPSNRAHLQCWESPDENDPQIATPDPKNSELVVSLAGVTGKLIKDRVTGVWQTEQDRGWKIEQLPGGESGDIYWKITDQQGTVYRLGYKRDASWQTRYYGNDTGEPCADQQYNRPFICAGTYRWNLDQESDVNANTIDYTWAREGNYFCPEATDTCGSGTGQTPFAAYDRGGYLQRVEWGHNSRIDGSVPTTKIEFTSSDRAAGTYPSELRCDTPSASCYNRTPSFFPVKQLTAIIAYARTPGTTTWDDVARVDLARKSVYQDMYLYYEWLDNLTMTGLAGDGQIALPKVSFDAVHVVARTEFDETANPTTQQRLSPRLGAITTELGNRTEISYGQPTTCGDRTVRHPIADCWRVVHAESNVSSEPYRAKAYTDHHKNMVVKVLERDLVGGSPDQSTRYEYLDNPTWVTPEDLLDPWNGNTYDGPNEWRGYGKVRTISDAEKSADSTISTQAFFRGLSGSLRRDPMGYTDTASKVYLTDFDGNSVEDSRPMAGQVLQTQSWRKTPQAPGMQEQAWWPFDEGAGTIAGDSSGHGFSLNLTGATWADAKHSTGLVFTGQQGYGSTSNPVVHTNASYSVAAWARLDTASGDRAFISQDGTVNSAFKLAYSPGDKKWRMATYASDTSNATASRALSAKEATVGRWTHLVGVYDAAAKKLRLYVDGTLEADVAYTSTWDASQGVQIGRTKLNGAFVNYLQGAIDDVRLYQRALTTQEVAALVSGTSAPAAASQGIPATSVTTEQIRLQQQAIMTGKPVEVASAGTNSSKTVANPDGTFTTEWWAQPVRILRDGKWVTTDPSLVEVDGVLKPKAAADVALSTGGDGPFVAIRDERGRSYSLSWPTALPRPVVKANTATYQLSATADLVVTVLPDGFRHDIVLHKPPTEPVEYRFDIATSGLRLAKGTSGGINLLDDTSGDLVAAVAEPHMWDSRTSQPQAKASAAGRGKIDAEILGNPGQQTLVFKPDAAFLTAGDTVYPVTVDPTLSLGPVQSAWTRDDGAVGFSDLWAGIMYVGTPETGYIARYTRSFIQFDTSTLRGATVTDATLKLRLGDGSTACPSTGLVQRVTSSWDWMSLNWSNRPSTTSTGQSTTANPNNCSLASGALETWSIKAIAQAWADGQPNHGLMLSEAPNSASNYSRNYNPASSSLAITYSTPGVDALDVTPRVPNSAPAVTDSLTPELSAQVVAPAAAGAQAEFEVQHDPAATGQGTGSIWAGSTADISQGNRARVVVPTGKLTEGWKLQWRARLSALVDGSTPTWSAWQPLTVNLSAAPPTPGNSTEDGYTELISTRYEYETRISGSRGSIQSSRVLLTRERIRERSTDGKYRFGDERTIHDAYGLPIEVRDYGQEGQPGDNTCTTTSYARNTNDGKWLIDYPALVQTRKGDDCATGEIIDRSLRLYDGATDPTANTPTAGDVTEVRSWTGSDTYTTSKTTVDAYGRPTSSTDANNNTSTITYTPGIGWPSQGITATNALGHTTTAVQSHLHGQTTWTRDANARISEIDYDALGRTTELWGPLQPRTAGTPTAKIAYTIPTDAASGRANGPARVTVSELRSGTGADAKWLTTHTYDDGFGRTRETQTASPNGGRIVSVTTYDQRGNPATASAPVHNSAEPGSGLLNPAMTALPQWTKYVYDFAEQVTASIDYSLDTELRRTTTNYFGDRYEVVPPVGTKTTHHTDLYGRVVKAEEWTDPANHNDTTYTYDVSGNLTKITDAKGNNRTFTHDWLGKQLAVSDPDTGSSSTGYTLTGQVAWTLDAKNNKISYRYDTLDRTVSKWKGELDTGIKLTEWTHDTLAKGLITSTTVFNNGRAYTEAVTEYDQEYRPTGTKVTIPATEGALAGEYTFSATYDTAGNLVEQGMPAAGGLPAEKITAGFTDLNYAHNLTSDHSGGFVYIKDTTYTATGRLKQRQYGQAGQVQRNLAWDESTGRLTNVQTLAKADTSSPATAQDDEFLYDLDNSLSRILDKASVLPGQTNGQSECFTYDQRRKLAAAWTTTAGNCTGGVASADGQGIDPYQQSYSYDTVGNLTKITDSGAESTYQYPTTPGAVRPNAITSITRPSGEETFAYDDAGQMTSRTHAGKTTTYQWDEQGRLAQSIIDGQTNENVYGPDGARLIRREPAKTTLYLGSMELELTTGQVTAKRYYVSGDGSTIAMRQTGRNSVLWLASDGQSSTQLAIDDATGTIERQRYLPFGGRRGARDDIASTDRGFLGKTEDNTSGLIQMSARYYDPVLARFISPDPLLDLRLPEWSNPYSYGANNPLLYSDPSGLRVDTGNRKSDKTFSKTHKPSGQKKKSYEIKLEKKHNKAVAAQDRKIKQTRARENARDAQIRDKKEAGESFRQREQRTTDKAQLCKRSRDCGKGIVRETDDVSIVIGVVTGGGGIAKAAAQGGIKAVGKAFTGKAVGPRPKTDGKWFPDRKLPRDKNGNPQPESDYPHTQLGWKKGRRDKYPQARDFGDNGEVMRDYDFTDHGRPNIPGHENPHQHRYTGNPTGGTKQRGSAEPWGW